MSGLGYTFILIFITQLLYGQTSIIYQSSNDDFANPERGFYRYSSTYSSAYNPLVQSTLESYRNLHTPWTANYDIYSTLLFRYFILDNFRTDSISQGFLDSIQTDFDVIRASGMKIIPRFAYTNQVNSSGCSSWICPPYGDAPKSIVLTHIGQLSSVLNNNKDVIACIQMGFIGVWGENYYTDHFGDASQPPDYKLSDSNWTDRIEVLHALLAASPVERMVQVRYPQMKQRTVFGVQATTNSDTLTFSEAFGSSNKARIGFHNDCLLASSTDYGTYTDYGNSSSSSMADTTNLKPYFARDSRFTVVGGETCEDAFSPQNDCSSTDTLAYADTELERMHYTYLNAQYNNDVNNDWVSGGCMDEIKIRLGYRFEMQQSSLTDAAQPGQTVDLSIEMKNVGYASPFNHRGLEFILRDTNTMQLWKVKLPFDPRTWYSADSSYHLNSTVCIPGEVPFGIYEALLHLPDTMSSLYANPDYSIRLANKLSGNSVWEPNTGFNKLGLYVEVDSSALQTPCNGQIVLNVSNKEIAAPHFDPQEFSVYPNPVKDVFIYQIDKTFISTRSTLRIYDLLGREMPYSLISNRKVDISQLPDAVYFVEYREGTERFIQKIIKSNN